MRFTELKKHFADGVFAGAYIVTGDDLFLVQAAVSRFKQLSINMPDFNVSVFSGGENAREIIEACEAFPVIDDKRIVIVDGFCGDGGQFLAYLKNPNPSTVLVFTVPSIKENVAKILNLTTLIDCARLDEGALMQYIARTAADFNSSFKVDAARLLIEFCASDLSRISKETEKLSHLKAGGVVDPSDIKECVTPETDYKIYELSEAVASRKNAEAAAILNSLIEAKVAPVALLGMLYSHFRRLLFCVINKSDPNLTTLLGVKPYAVQKAMQSASKYTAVRLKKICDSLSAADYDFKSGKISDLLALECCVFGVLSA